RETHIEYDPAWPSQPNERVFPSQVWQQFENPKYRPSYWVAFHPAYGVPMARMEMNGVNHPSAYDDLGRVIVDYPPGESELKVTYAGRPDKYGGQNGTIVTGTVDGQQSVATFDALGRGIKTAQTGFDGTLVYVANIYDVLGRRVSESRPYQAAPPE